MDITAEKYYDDNLENYNFLNKIDPITAKQAMEMMEGYHQSKLKLLGIADVIECLEQVNATIERHGKVEVNTDLHNKIRNTL